MEAINITAFTNDNTQINALKAMMKALKIKFEISKVKEEKYNPEFVAKIKESKQQFKDGNFSTLTLDEIWKND
jgi:hypothetical protein